MIVRRLAVLLPLLVLAGCERETQVERATREGILVIGNSNEPKGLDPQVVTGVLESNIMRALFEGLVSFHPSDDAANVLTGAESLEPDDTATVWTARLRPDAVWSDGVPVTAEDYVFSYHRMLSPDFAAKYADMLHFLRNGAIYNRDLRGEILFRISPPAGGPSWNDVRGVSFRGAEHPQADTLGDRDWSDLDEHERVVFATVRGLDALNREQLEWIAGSPDERFLWPEGFPHSRAVVDRLLAHAGEDLWNLARVGIEQTDKFGLRITLRGPTPYFPQLAKHYTWTPVPKHVVLKNGGMSDRSNPWSKFGHIVTNGPFRLKSWRLTDHLEVERNPLYWNAGNVTLNGVRYIPVSNSYTEARMFRDGQLHMTYSAPPEVIDWFQNNQPDRLRQEPYVGTLFYRCNTTREPLNDLRVRQALALAIDREVICDKVLKGYKPAYGITPPMADYQIEARDTYDPERARQLLAEAGYPEGKGFPRRLKILLASRETAATLAQAIQAMWRETLGIQVEIENKEWTAYLAAMQDSDYDLASSGWIGDYLDPLTFLEMWTTGNGNNLTGWSSESFEELLRQSHQEADPVQRYQLLEAAENLFVDDSPVLLVAWYSRNYLIDPSVKGWNPLLLDNHPYDKIRLEPATR